MENIILTTDDDIEVEFSVIADTKLGGVTYLLVAEAMSDYEDEEENALILKEISSEGDTEKQYEILEDDNEFDIVAKLFAAEIDDEDIEII